MSPGGGWIHENVDDGNRSCVCGGRNRVGTTDDELVQFAARGRVFDRSKRGAKIIKGGAELGIAGSE
ncbi:MAG: hypothetical protein VW800_10960, partial [Acidimicrobiaceae bacterium]